MKEHPNAINNLMKEHPNAIHNLECSADREVRAGSKRAEVKHYPLAVGFGFTGSLNHLNQRGVQVWI